MKISKQTERMLRKEYSLLKKYQLKQIKENEAFIKKHCKNLLHCCQERWDYPIDQIFEDVPALSVDNLLHDFRNH